jgi:hypothetical protein
MQIELQNNAVLTGSYWCYWWVRIPLGFVEVADVQDTLWDVTGVL